MVLERASALGGEWFADSSGFRELSKLPEFVAGLLAHTRDGLSIADPDGKCVLVNRALCEMTGFSAAELLVAPPYAYWPAEQHALIRGALTRFEQRDTTQTEVSLQRKNGERFPALLRLSLVCDENGRPLSSLSTITDCSATQQAAAALKASEQRWRSIVENPFDFVMIIDRSYKYRFINQVIPGLRVEDLVDVLSPFDFLAPEDQPRVRQVFDEVVRTGRAAAYEVYLPDLHRWYSNVVGPIESDGEVRELSLLSRDITDIKQREREQRRTERRLELALASVQDGVVELDPRTGHHAYSARTYELLGFAEGDPELSTRADGLLARVHPEDVSLVSRELQTALDGGATFNREFRLRAKDGSYRWFQVRGRIVEDEEKSFVAFLTDVTQRYEAEEQQRALAAELQQAQRLETIGTLAGGIAHDFNNLLTPIMAALEFAQLALPTEHSAHAVLDDARSAAQRAKSLTEQILTFARRGQLRLDPVDLVRLVRDELRLQPIAANVELRTEFAPDVPAVMGDRTQLQQIISNLLANALHAMRGRNGQILVRVDRLRLERPDANGEGQISAGDHVRLTVSDQGVGMPESVQRRVFEPFFTTKPLGQGTGLGLAVVHGVVARHGGHLRLHSEPGKGTSFEIYLPAAPSAQVHPSERAPSGGLHAALSGYVGCVDDEAAVLGVMQRALEMANYSVQAATSPTQALAWFVAGAPRLDVLVTDYRMPELSGLELANHVHAIRPDLPVILVTGHAEGLPTSSVPPGIYAVIRKPFRLSELIQCVQRCLSEASLAADQRML
jgi:PAS domain S-box-containing protein